MEIHTHGWTNSGKTTLKEGFSFHASLSKWISEYTDIPIDAELEILELTCGEVSCPTAETLFVWNEVDPSGQTTSNQFRISRKKEQISKMDVKLSWERRGKII